MVPKPQYRYSKNQRAPQSRAPGLELKHGVVVGLGLLGDSRAGRKDSPTNHSQYDGSKGLAGLHEEQSHSWDPAGEARKLQKLPARVCIAPQMIQAGCCTSLSLLSFPRLVVLFSYDGARDSRWIPQALLFGPAGLARAEMWTLTLQVQSYRGRHDAQGVQDSTFSWPSSGWLLGFFGGSTIFTTLGHKGLKKDQNCGSSGSSGSSSSSSNFKATSKGYR